jgi:hypothetical protein
VLFLENVHKHLDRFKKFIEELEGIETVEKSKTKKFELAEFDKNFNTCVEKYIEDFCFYHIY